MADNVKQFPKPMTRDDVAEIVQRGVNLGRAQVELEIDERVENARRDGIAEGMRRAGELYANHERLIGAAVLVGVAIGVVLTVLAGPAVARLLA